MASGIFDAIWLKNTPHLRFLTASCNGEVDMFEVVDGKNIKRTNLLKIQDKKCLYLDVSERGDQLRFLVADDAKEVHLFIQK